MLSTFTKTYKRMTSIDLQEKRILLYIDRVLGVRIVMSEKLTSQMIVEGGCGASLLTRLLLSLPA